jgi:hypothetical protein
VNVGLCDRNSYFGVSGGANIITRVLIRRVRVRTREVEIRARQRELEDAALLVLICRRSHEPNSAGGSEKRAFLLDNLQKESTLSTS